MKVAKDLKATVMFDVKHMKTRFQYNTHKAFGSMSSIVIVQTKFLLHVVRIVYIYMQMSRHKVVCTFCFCYSASLLKKSMAHLSAWYFSNGSAVLAACCHLAVDDFQV